MMFGSSVHVWLTAMLFLVVGSASAGPPVFRPLPITPVKPPRPLPPPTPPPPPPRPVRTPSKPPGVHQNQLQRPVTRAMYDGTRRPGTAAGTRNGRGIYPTPRRTSLRSEIYRGRVARVKPRSLEAPRGRVTRSRAPTRSTGRIPGWKLPDRLPVIAPTADLPRRQIPLANSLLVNHQAWSATLSVLRATSVLGRPMFETFGRRRGSDGKRGSWRHDPIRRPLRTELR